MALPPVTVSVRAYRDPDRGNALTSEVKLNDVVIPGALVDAEIVSSSGAGRHPLVTLRFSANLVIDDEL